MGHADISLHSAVFDVTMYTKAVRILGGWVGVCSHNIYMYCTLRVWVGGALRIYTCMLNGYVPP